MAGLALSLLHASCSTRDVEPVASSAAPLTVAPNYQAEGWNMHYADAVAAKDPGSGLWRWLVAYDNCSSLNPAAGNLQCDEQFSPNRAGLVGWAYSTDLTG
ncbi:MAG TPA: hypothetical protein VGH87_00675, partial [Polyangiaceae bacterium]